MCAGIGSSLYFLGMAVGISIGRRYYKHQIVKKRNPNVIAEVRDWLRRAEIDK